MRHRKTKIQMCIRDRYIIIMYGAGYVLYLINPAFYAQYLCLNAQAILHGQVWRIITFIIQPPSYRDVYQRQTIHCSYNKSGSIDSCLLYTSRCVEETGKQSMQHCGTMHRRTVLQLKDSRNQNQIFTKVKRMRQKSIKSQR